MGEDSFETLCAIRGLLLSLGLGSLVDMLADGEDEAVERACPAATAVRILIKREAERLAAKEARR